MIRPRYSLMIDDMRAVQNNLEDTYDECTRLALKSSATEPYMRKIL